MRPRPRPERVRPKTRPRPKVFRGQGPRPQYEDEARHVRTTQCVWAWRLRYWRSEHNFQWATNRPTQQKWMLMVILWILINVMCTVNIRGHEANFYEARCHDRGQKEWGRGWMIWPRGLNIPGRGSILLWRRCDTSVPPVLQITSRSPNFSHRPMSTQVKYKAPT